MFYNYKYGVLEYRSLKFENEILDIKNFQGNAVVNYTDSETPFTRIIEHKHFEFVETPKTFITREYSVPWSKELEAYYPINDSINQEMYEKYSKLTLKDDKYIFGGRLAEYKYYDIDQVILSALNLVDKEFK